MASHSEDWKRRTATSIEPSHVVAEILENQTNIYENRVAAELVDRIVGTWQSELPPVIQFARRLRAYLRGILASAKGRTLTNQASMLWKELIGSCQDLITAIFWDNSDRFERFCTGPSSCRGHHMERGGNSGTR